MAAVLAVLADHVFGLFMLAFLLVASAFFSGSETALFSLPRETLRDLERDRTPAGDRILRLLRDPKLLLATILVGNMGVNILFYSISYRVVEDAARRASPFAGGALSLVTLALVVVFAEVGPKNVAVARPMRFARLVAAPLLLFEKAAYPAARACAFLAQQMSAWIAKYARRELYVNAEELKMLVEMAEHRGVIRGAAPAMMQEVVNLGMTRVKQIMVHRVDVAMFRLEEGRERLVELIRRTRHKRYLVYEQSIDDTSKALLSREVLLSPEEPLENLLRPVVFVPETMTVEKLLRQFRQQGLDFAVAVDEYGGTAGMVTIEDVIEEVFGEIEDEHDAPAEGVEQVAPGTYVLPGDLSLADWREAFGLELPPADVDTVGGVITALLGRMPRVGDSATFQGMEFTVAEMRRRRIRRARLRLIPEGEDRWGEGGAGA